MEVKDKIMYHYHNRDIYSDIWKPGNEIIVDDNFDSYFCKRAKEYTPAVDVNYKNDVRKESFDYLLEEYLDEEKFKTIDRKLAMQMLMETIGIIRNGNLCRREYLLEDYRKNNYPNLPSRFHSIWVTDENSLDFWESKLSKSDYLKLCKLQITGELFKSSDLYLPNNEFTMEEMYESSERYWNPDLSYNVANERAEYLFQGKVKILEMKNVKR